MSQFGAVLILQVASRALDGASEEREYHLTRASVVMDPDEREITAFDCINI